MPKKSYKRKQKLYKMVGCSRKTCKNHLGGSADVNLAYTGKPVPTIPNPFLAYTGKGGSSNIPINTDAANPLYPNTGPVSNGADTIYNNASQQRGGGCNCGGLMTGGGTGGGTCPFCKFMSGGTKHRDGCMCSRCKSSSFLMKGGNSGIPYPDGTVGTPYTPDSLPGSLGTAPGDSNFYPLNTYTFDTPLKMISTSSGGGRRRKNKYNKTQRGGNVTNFIGQDLINLGRQFQFGVGSAYNALAGYSAPVNPLPWKDQFPTTNKLNMSTI